MHATAAQAARLSGCSGTQLAAWARSGLLRPSAPDGGYAFADLVGLRMVRSLLDAGLSLAKVRRAIGYLRGASARPDTPSDDAQHLAGLRLVTDGDRVWACHDDGQILDALRQGQLALFVAVDRFVDEVEAEIAAFDAEREAFIVGLEPGDDAASAS